MDICIRNLSNDLIFFFNSVTESEGDDMFQVSIYKNGNHPRIWTQTLNRHDGSFIVRFKLYETYKNLKIHILYKNKHVAKSPYLLDGKIS